VGESASGEIEWPEGLSSSCLVRGSKLICGDNSRLLIVHRRYNGRRVRESTMGLAIPVCRNGVKSHLGRGVEVVVIDRIRAGRVLAFVASAAEISDERSALEAWRGNHSVRRDPRAFRVPLSAVLETRVSIMHGGKGPSGSHMLNRSVRVDGQSRSQLAG